jgi:hypothetical protein
MDYMLEEPEEPIRRPDAEENRTTNGATKPQTVPMIGGSRSVTVFTDDKKQEN